MSLLTDLQKMDTDLKQVRTDTNVALTEKGGTEVQNLNEIAEAVRGLPSGGGSCWTDYSVGFNLGLKKAFKNVVFPENTEIVINNVNELAPDCTEAFYGISSCKKIKVSSKKASYPNGKEKEGYFCYMMFNGARDVEEIDFSELRYNPDETFPRIWYYPFMFFGCRKLKRIRGALGLVGSDWNTFEQCLSLRDVTIAPDIISYGFNIARCPALSPESIQSIIDGLATVTAPQTLTLHENIVLTAEQKETIRTKGWTLAQ